MSGHSHLSHGVMVGFFLLQISGGDSRQQQQQKYFILLLITDGLIDDVQETIDEIVEASKETIPMSIIIVLLSPTWSEALSCALELGWSWRWC